MIHLKAIGSVFLLFYIGSIPLRAEEPMEQLSQAESEETEAESADRKPATIPLLKYEIELKGKRNFKKLSLFSEKLLGSFSGESRLVKKMITQDKVVYELSVSQDLQAVKEALSGVQKNLAGLTLIETQGEKIMMELK